MVVTLGVGVLLAAGAVAAPSTALPGGFAAAWKETKALFEAELKQHRHVGGSLLLVHDDRVVARAYAGMANLEKGWPVDEDTIYHWASNTKTFTGVAIMQLRDRGLLTLDDPIAKYLPELRAVHNPYGPMEAITLRHLMTHTAGFQGKTWPWGGDQPWHPHEPLHWFQLVAMFPYMEIGFPPGSKFSYSNPGIIFLGRVIEELTTDDYEVYIDKNILKPLEMYRSYFDVTPYHLARHKAQSYTLGDSGPVPARAETNTGITVSNGGLNAPLDDFAKYVAFVLGDPAHPARQAVYDGVLKRSSLEEMFVPRVPTGREAEPAGKEEMGLTYFSEVVDGVRLVGHSGSQNGFVTRFQVDLGSRTAYVMAFNTLAFTETGAAPSSKALMDRIKQQIVKKVFPLFRQR